MNLNLYKRNIKIKNAPKKVRFNYLKIEIYS